MSGYLGSASPEGVVMGMIEVKVLKKDLKSDFYGQHNYSANSNECSSEYRLIEVARLLPGLGLGCWRSE